MSFWGFIFAAIGVAVLTNGSDGQIGKIIGSLIAIGIGLLMFFGGLGASKDSAALTRDYRAEKQKALQGILLVTSGDVAGREIVEVKGIVNGSFSSTYVSGSVAMNNAQDNLRQNALAMGANAVINVSQTVSDKRILVSPTETVLMLTGTAVVLK